MAEQTPTRRPKGRPLAWAESALDALATVTEADQQAAIASWDANAPAALRGLLEAETWEGGPNG